MDFIFLPDIFFEFGSDLSMCYPTASFTGFTMFMAEFRAGNDVPSKWTMFHFLYKAKWMHGTSTQQANAVFSISSVKE